MEIRTAAMEESQEILLNSLQKSGVSVPPDVSSIRNLTPPLLFSICAQVLNRIHGQTQIPYATSLPDSVADQFKICTEIASAIKDLGYIGDMSFHKVCPLFCLLEFRKILGDCEKSVCLWTNIPILLLFYLVHL